MENKRERTTKRSKRWYVLAVAIGIILVLALIVWLARRTKSEDLALDRIECPGLSEEDCPRRMCRFQKMESGPSCYMEKDAFGYRFQSATAEAAGQSVRLQSLSPDTPYGSSLRNVLFRVTHVTEHIVRFQFKDADAERYEVPVQKYFPLLQTSRAPVVQPGYEVETTNETGSAFHFAIKRKDGTRLWDSGIGALLLSDQYLQIATYLPSKNVYGLGEHVHDTLRHNLTYVSWPMFARDRMPNSQADYKNLYGVHPFYTCLEKSGKSHGVLFLNSNAMEATLMPAPAISFRTIGGILDFFIFVGDDPEHVVRLYTSLVGRPALPPYWGLGFQLARYGYDNITNLMEVMERNRRAEIPQAVQYLDIDHMKDSMDFTYDRDTFPNLPEYVQKTKRERGLKWIIILDPGIPVASDYEPYSRGLEREVFVKRSGLWSSGMFPEDPERFNITFGKVWPTPLVAFPDFFLDQTKAWWKEQIVRHRDTIEFDGLWIDMNEPANFARDVYFPGYCEYNRDEGKKCWGTKCPESPREDPPYNPVQSAGDPKLSEKTLCMDSVQGISYRHYDVHSLYGWSQTQPTQEAAQLATRTRSLVISRSTYPSSGRHGGHWLGDNRSTFDDMKRSIIGMLEFNLFGIPYIGADVCGFEEVATAELCKRWMQLGAFYPYYRNHNSIGRKDQDPAIFGDEVVVPSRKAIERRLCLNPYLYTLFYRAHVEGSTVVRPVFHEYPEDEATWDMSTQFMWGKSLLIVPILDENQKSVNIYLPNDEWWLFKEQESVQKSIAQRHVVERDADEYTPLYVRGGTVLPYGTYEKNGNETYRRKISLYVFPEEGAAAGELFMDDGISKDTIENEAYALYEFRYADCSLKISALEKSNFGGVYPILQNLVVFKVKAISKVDEDYPYTLDQTYHRAVIAVDKEMKSVKNIKWSDSTGKCQMIE